MAQPNVTSTACARLLRSSYKKASHLTSTPFPLRASTATSSPSPVLDFLAPSILQHPVRTRPAGSSQRHAPPSYLQRTRPFSSTPVSRHAILNPRKDDDGNEMNISITPRAANVSALVYHLTRLRSSLSCSYSSKMPRLTQPFQRLAQISNTDRNPNLCLRISVESGGCHGFQYLMSLTNTSVVSPEDDTIFEASDGSGAKVVMDEPSLELLKGSSVDFTMELIGSQFKIVGNPAATSSCGCGTSFDIKV